MVILAGVRTLVRQYPTTTFFGLTFLLTWVVWVPRAIGPTGWAASVGMYWTWMPAIAAVVTAALVGGGALRDLGARLVRWRVGWRWYLLVLAGPAAFWALVWTVAAAAGWTGDLAQPMLIEQGVASVLVLLPVLALTDGLGEETGWRGFALPRMLDRLGPVVASVLLGLLWALWHLPLFFTEGLALYGGSPWLLLLELPAVSVIYTWVFQRTGGSVLLAILLHASMNLAVLNASMAGATVRVTVLVVLAKWLLAAVVIVAWRRGQWKASHPTRAV